MEKQRWEESEKRREEKRREEERRSEKRKSQRKEDAGVRKGRKDAIHCVFPMICGSGGSKSRLANARRCGAKHIWKSKCTKHTMLGPLLEVEMSKKCTPLWREAHFQVKMYKTLQCRSTFGRWHVEKVDAAVARSQNGKSTTCSDHFWRFRCGFAWQAQAILRLGKSEQNVKVLAAFRKTMAGVGHLKRIWKDAFRVAGAVHETCSSEMLGGQGVDFLRGVAFWSIRSSGLLRCDRRSTLYYMVSLLRDRRSTLHSWSGKIAKPIGTRPSALHSTLHFWRKSRRIA